jgi:dihydroorotate dehydrogenase (fumarate)
MNLSTNYMRFELPHPLVPGASPLSDNLDKVKRLEDAGAPLIVMHSLFEEQIVRESAAVERAIEMPRDSYAEALSYFPESVEFALGPDEYLEQVRRIKATVGVPVVASLNGVSVGGWIRYAKLIQEAGADGLELNIYDVPADPTEQGARTELRLLDVVESVRRTVSIPLAVKLSPFFSSPANFIRQVDDVGVDGILLFNRFYQPDLDIETLDILRTVRLSDSSELLLRLRWLALLYGAVKAPLAATGGIHTVADVIKSIMAGASVCQVVSAILMRGPDYLRTLHDGLVQWMEEHEYESLRQMQGSLSVQRVPNPGALERANYAKILQTWEFHSY